MVQGHPQIHTEFEASLSYLRPYGRRWKGKPKKPSVMPKTAELGVILDPCSLSSSLDSSHNIVLNHSFCNRKITQPLEESGAIRVEFF